MSLLPDPVGPIALRTALCAAIAALLLATSAAAFRSNLRYPLSSRRRLEHSRRIPTVSSRLWVHQASNGTAAHVCDEVILDRRRCLTSLRTAGLLFVPATATSVGTPALAVEELSEAEQQQRMVFNQRPRAPLSVLLPATEQRMLLKECLSLSEQLVDASRSNVGGTNAQAIRRLQTILINPKVEGGGSYNYYTRGLTEKKRSERDLRIISQYQESQPKRLSGNIVRATMNTYISNLRYGSEYTVEDPEWKSAYIRKYGGLPDFRKVVQADLDLRILYMNQVQLRVDDAAAEFYAALGDGENEFEELRRLLQLAEESMDAWFNLIGDADVDDASQAVKEGKTVKLADNAYMAGFVPPVR